MNKNGVLLLFAGALLALALVQPALTQLRAESDIKPEAGALAADAEGTYEIDPVHSTLLFRVGHLGVSFVYGRFNDFSGSFTFAPSDLSASEIELTAKTESVDTGNDRRDGHLRSADFFGVEEFSTMLFKSKSVSKGENGTIEVTGDFTLHGVTKEIVVPVTFVGAGEGRGNEFHAGFEAVFTINRSDYGMATMLGPVGDEVRITVAIEGKRKNAAQE